MYVHVYLYWRHSNKYKWCSPREAGGGDNRELVFVNVGMVLKISPSRFFFWTLITICRFDRQSFMMVIFFRTYSKFVLKLTIVARLCSVTMIRYTILFFKYGKLFTQTSIFIRRICLYSIYDNFFDQKQTFDIAFLRALGQGFLCYGVVI